MPKAPFGFLDGPCTYVGTWEHLRWNGPFGLIYDNLQSWKHSLLNSIMLVLTEPSFLRLIAFCIWNGHHGCSDDVVDVFLVVLWFMWSKILGSKPVGSKNMWYICTYRVWVGRKLKKCYTWGPPRAGTTRYVSCTRKQSRTQRVGRKWKDAKHPCHSVAQQVDRTRNQCSSRRSTRRNGFFEMESDQDNTRR